METFLVAYCIWKQKQKCKLLLQKLSTYNISTRYSQLLRPVYILLVLFILCCIGDADCLLLCVFPPPAPTWLEPHLHGNWDFTCRWDSLTRWLKFRETWRAWEGHRGLRKCMEIKVHPLCFYFSQFYPCLFENRNSQEGRGGKLVWLLIKAVIKLEPMYL